MKVRMPRLSLPLLAKELVEQAARRRTYSVRTIYAAFLFFFSGMYLYSFFDRADGNALWVLGRGHELFAMIVFVQFAGIYLFLPALMSGAITREKERDSLVLLMLTTLRPREILLQKYLSGLVPMGTFLLLSLPLMAIAYTLGGVTSDAIVAAIIMLTLCCLQVGALALLLSTWCRSTAAAFIGFYLVAAAIYFVPIMLYSMFWWSIFNGVDEWVYALIPPVVYIVHLDMNMMGTTGLPDLMWHATPIIMSTVLFLVLARVFLVRRAMLPPRNALLAVFRWLDKLFTRANRITGGITLWRDTDTLPGDKAIAWREVYRKSMGKLHHRIRVLLLLQAPIGFVILVTLYDHGGNGEGLGVVLMFLWIIVALILTVMAANLFTVERSRQTMDTMLTMPITGSEIIRQKMAGLWRVAFTLWIPFLSIYIAQAYLHWGGTSSYYYGYNDGNAAYLTSSLLSLVIYLPLVMWLGVAISLLVRSQAKAIVAAVAVLVIWLMGVPIILAIVSEAFRINSNSSYRWLFLLSPATIIPYTEFRDLREFDTVPGVIIFNFMMHGSILLLLRQFVLSRADRMLQRV